ncbi:hypothetical protein FGO68_gene6057 [Halteria grandinella]|uniref:Man1/Src1-like C-terminal domain-containing protein n=1 Tax=Halteria grandinella TaxID=5974 RepID=A0A8J8SXK5_HALGN|nr:hypothetical protein FGO68_gene6057 [Halteria grandinella]
MGGRQSARGKESKSISRKASQDSLSTYNLGNESSIQTPKRGEGKCLRSEGPAASVSLITSNLAKSRGTGIKNVRPQSKSKVNVSKRHDSKRRRNSGQNSNDEEEVAIKDPRLKKSEKSKRVRKQNDSKTQHINQPSDHLQSKGRLLFPDFPAFDQIQEEEIEESIEQKDQAPSSSYTQTIQQQEEDVDLSSTYLHQERNQVTVSKFEKIVENVSSTPKIVYEQQPSIVSLPLLKNTAESLEYQSVSMKMQDSFQEEQMIVSNEQIQLGYVNEGDEQIVEGKPQESSMPLTPQSQSATQSLESSVKNQSFMEPECQEAPKFEQKDVENDVEMINEEEQTIQPIEPSIQLIVNEPVETISSQIQNPIQKPLSRQGSGVQQSESNVPEIFMELNHDYVSKVADTFSTPVERLSGDSKNSILSQPLLNKKLSEQSQSKTYKSPDFPPFGASPTSHTAIQSPSFSRRVSSETKPKNIQKYWIPNEEQRLWQKLGGLIFIILALTSLYMLTNFQELAQPEEEYHQQEENRGNVFCPSDISQDYLDQIKACKSCDLLKDQMVSTSNGFLSLQQTCKIYKQCKACPSNAICTVDNNFECQSGYHSKGQFQCVPDVSQETIARNVIHKLQSLLKERLGTANSEGKGEPEYFSYADLRQLASSEIDPEDKAQNYESVLKIIIDELNARKGGEIQWKDTQSGKVNEVIGTLNIEHLVYFTDEPQYTEIQFILYQLRTNFFIILALLSITVYIIYLTISKVQTFLKDVQDDKISEDIYRLVKTYLQGHYDQSPALTKAEVYSMSGMRDLQGFEQSIWPKLEQIRERDRALAKNEQIIKHRLQSVWRLKKYQ